MAKINFKQLEIFLDMQKQKSTVQDVRRLIGNLVYGNTYGLDGHLLAHKIAEADGEVELSELEAKDVARSVLDACAPPLIDAILCKLGLTIEDVATNKATASDDR